MNETKIIIADDHAVFRTGLVSIVNDMPGFSVIGETDSGKELIELVTSLKPGLIITDDRMHEQSGADALHQLKLRKSLPPAIVISSYYELENVERCIQAGALSFIEKIAGIEELSKAIHTVNSFLPYFPEAEHMKLFISIRNHPDKKAKTSAIFSEKEIQIIKLILKEYNNAGIADFLSISIKTVESYRQRIYQKAGVKSAIGLSEFIHKRFTSL